MRFSKFFGIPGSQASFDFVDVPLDTDIRLFLDPYAVVVTPTRFAQRLHEMSHNYFRTVVRHISAGNQDAAVGLVAELHEDNRTRTGFSTRQPKGKAFGILKAKPLVEAIAASVGFKEGQIVEIEDVSLLVPGVGIDLVSDIMINVVREQLAEYTADQCRLYGIPMTHEDTFKTWRKDTGWTTVSCNVPDYHGRPILLLPRSLVRRELSLTPEKFLTGVFDSVGRGEPAALAALKVIIVTPPRKKDGSINRRGELRL